MLILSIESSCDETSVAVTAHREVLSNIISTQIDEHRIYGGVVPEIASRRHCENICAVANEAISKANVQWQDIDAVAVTAYPGLIGALLTGVNFAKGLSLSLSKPLIAVHHLRSHIAANYITHKDLKPPFLCLVVSGGNTVICSVKDYTDFTIIGQTLDDAAGECFDKAARAMGLEYPGGVNLDKIASVADEKQYPLPTPNISGGEYDFSFSGLKTAVLNLIHNKNQKGESVDVPVLCATLRKKVCDILISKTLKAAKDTGHTKIVLAGGVSANSELRRRMEEECIKNGFEFYTPHLAYCGDNAAMVGAQAFYEYKSGNVADVSLNASATLPIDLKV
ncbi:MAG: tRNA (adenosine(37)-N6)-threonylcarbamoyltransferase complex transferase subunit TsaD [Acutalibacteraceae bacterium]|nr:tRNA (adenosine(37)-N6)-threonylcarbamoyltransferase complex transferase subunit TsaD [Acutalibacteraceae bacterium]